MPDTGALLGRDHCAGIVRLIDVIQTECRDGCSAEGRQGRAAIARGNRIGEVVIFGQLIRLGWAGLQRLTLGREALMLGKVRVGEISPVKFGRYQACFCLRQAPATLQRAGDATRLALAKVND